MQITTEEIYALTLLAPLLRELHERHPEILIELDTVSRSATSARAKPTSRCAAAQKSNPAGLGRPQDLRRRLGALLQPRLRGAARRPETHPGAEEARLYRRRRRQFVEPLSSLASGLGLEQQVAMHHATSGGLLSGVRSGFGIAVCRASSPTPIPSLSAAFRRARTTGACCGCSPTSASATRRASGPSSTSSTSGSCRHVRQLEESRRPPSAR